MKIQRWIQIVSISLSLYLLVTSASTSGPGGAAAGAVGTAGAAVAGVVPSARSAIESFKVMDVLARATELEREGRHICHMEVGQPSTGAPKAILEAAQRQLSNSILGYTNALGIDELRQKIATHVYKDKYGVEVSPSRIVITTGSSAGFCLIFLGCFDIGDHIALCSSGYPCYRNIMKATGLHSVNIAVNRDFKVTAVELLAEIVRRQTAEEAPLKALIMSSPSNPTGAMLTPDELRDLCQTCDAHNILFLSDEIYHGISYTDSAEASAVQCTDRAIVINSFSKYFSMTGWRLGWLVVPPSLVDVMNRLSQNMYINAPTLSQYAALSAFEPEVTTELNAHVVKYRTNRDIVLATLKDLQIDQNASPADGAFYVYVDLAREGVTDSGAVCRRLLEEAGVAITPGLDFEDPASGLGHQRLRFSYSRSTDEVQEGMRRFKQWWVDNMKK